MPPMSDARKARSAWQRLDGAGGVITGPELAERWQVTRQRIAVIVAGPEFPEPLVPAQGRRPAVWLAAEVEQWREQHLTRVKTGPKTSFPAILDTPADPAAARRAWRSVEAAGGVSTSRQLADALQLTTASVDRQVQRPEWPEPVAPGLWLTAEAIAAYTPRYRT
jgi:predicted DNA-binding transcriptional regulator AlpA